MQGSLVKVVWRVAEILGHWALGMLDLGLVTIEVNWLVASREVSRSIAAFTHISVYEGVVGASKR